GAIRQVRQHEPDVLTLDLALCHDDCLPLLDRLRQECPRTRVLVVTLLDAPALLQAVLAAGGKGYVLKTVPAAALLEAGRRRAPRGNVGDGRAGCACAGGPGPGWAGILGAPGRASGGRASSPPGAAGTGLAGAKMLRTPVSFAASLKWKDCR